LAEDLRDTPYNAACVADADDTLVRGAGTVFATVGTGGTPLRNVNTADTEAGYFRAFSGANRSPSHGFLDVAADATTLTARFTPSPAASRTPSRSGAARRRTSRRPRPSA
jgi:hypothetical protein